jgi:hypothetical protein
MNEQRIEMSVLKDNKILIRTKIKEIEERMDEYDEIEKHVIFLCLNLFLKIT